MCVTGKSDIQGILSFLQFPDTFGIQGILLILLFLDTYTISSTIFQSHPLFSISIPFHLLFPISSTFREAVKAKQVTKLWTLSVPPLAPPPIYGHLGGCFIVKLVVLS